MSEEDELLAAELALGLLDGDERRAAEARRARDDTFADAVARWENYGATMLAGAGEQPRPSLWPAIAARLPANDSKPADAPARRWKLATLAACAAALLLGVTTLERPVRLVPTPVATAARAPMVAMLTGTASKAVLAVSFDPASGRLTLAPRALDPGAGSAELWAIPADKRPRSLGVVAIGASWRPTPASARAAIAAGVTLAVSLEPAGGSPTGAPTGPVVLTGTLHEI